MSTEFDAVFDGLAPHCSLKERVDAMMVLRNIEASHAALVAQRDALLAAAEAIICDRRSSYSCTIRSVQALEAAVALSKGTK